MYKNRDPRDTIITHIIKDLDFAAEHIRTESSIGNTRISKNAAYALKSRACLWEASWRKYHNLETEQWSAEALYRQAVEAAKAVMNDSRVKLNTTICADAYMTNNPSLGAYRSLFYSKEPMTDEVILGVQASLTDLVTGDAEMKVLSLLAARIVTATAEKYHRSPDHASAVQAHFIDPDGEASGTDSVDDTYIGVVPALCIKSGNL